MIPPLLLIAFIVGARIADPAQTSPVAVIIVIASTVFFAIYVLSALVVFIRKARRQDRWVLWSKLRVAAIGLVFGLTPLIVATLFRQLDPSHSLDLVDHASVVFLTLVPASFSLALLRTGAIGMAYLWRQAAIAVALSIPLLLVGVVMFAGLAPALSGANRGAAYLLTVGGVLLASTLITPTRHRVAALVDRLFFRESLGLRAAAATLGNQLSQLKLPHEVAQTLAYGLWDLFGSTHVVLYQSGEDHLKRLVESTPQPKAEAPEFLTTSSFLTKTAVESGEMLLVEPLLTGPRSRRFDEESRNLLDTTDAVLLCPLIVGGKTVGLLVLGPPQNGGSYSSLHLFHIELLARQAAAAFEAAQLHQEDMDRERMRIELDLARQIQSKLLPESDLDAGPFRVHGRMLSSQQVGGDLFDHFVMADGRVVVSVADASGKGVPASLLISSLRSAIRETMRPGNPLPDGMAHLNREVHGTTALQHFVALFVGILDPRSHVLEYSVAGIEPPLWYRAQTGRVETLGRGGPVLGVDPTAGYKSGLVRLSVNDVVVAYSDGITDQENATGGEFGSVRLVRALTRLAERDAPDIVEALMAAVGHFGHGDPTDDRTLLALKFNHEEPDGMESAWVDQKAG